LSKVEPIEPLFQWPRHSAHTHPITLTEGWIEEYVHCHTVAEKERESLSGTPEQYRNFCQNVKPFRDQKDEGQRRLAPKIV
jgi:hypothetical protein